jgi:DUF1009 family protein
MKELTKVGILAGGGMMPVEIIKSCHSRGIEVYVAGLLPWANESTFLPGIEGALPEGVPHVMARLGEVGKMMKFFQSHGVTELVLAGGIKRPALKELIPDFEAIKMLAKLALKKQSDDGLFRSVIREIESRGFHVLGIEEVVPEMLFHEGVYGRVKPSGDDMDDIRRGIEIARALGAVDVGQAVVIQEGIVLAVEAVEGTDAMLSRAASLKKPGKAPVMVKIKKPGQDTRVDLPAIGLQTIEQLAKYGIGGIAVEAEGILVIEREAVIAAADAAKIFITGMKI